MGGSPLDRVLRVSELYPDDAILADEVRQILAELESDDQIFAGLQADNLRLTELVKQFQDREASMRNQREAYNAMVTNMLDKAGSYANVVMSVGFAGLLTAWTVNSAKYSDGQNLFLGLCILVSLFAFVVWEILKMLIISMEGGSLQNVVEKPWPDMSAEERRFHSRFEAVDAWFKRAWKWFFGTSFLFGLVAAVTLGALTVRRLMG